MSRMPWTAMPDSVCCLVEDVCGVSSSTVVLSGGLRFVDSRPNLFQRCAPKPLRFCGHDSVLELVIDRFAGSPVNKIPKGGFHRATGCNALEGQIAAIEIR